MARKRNRNLALAVALTMACLVAACHAPAGTPRSAVEKFLDAHYVSIDLQASQRLVTGLALQKVNKEIALVEGLEPEAQALKPRIGYRLKQTREGEQEVTYLYELTVAPSGVEPFGKEVIVTARFADDDWTVSNYSEADKQVD